MTDLSAETAVLGGLLLDPSPADIAEVLSSLSRDAFSKPAHVAIYGCLAELHEVGTRNVDEVLLRQKLSERGVLDVAGGALGISELVESTPTAANIRHYAKIVRQHWQRRRLAALGAKTQQLAKDESRPVRDVIEDVSRQVSDIASDHASAIKSLKTLARQEWREIQRAFEAAEAAAGLSTGLRDLDAMLAGLQPQDLVIIAGRPSMGKTSLALGFARHAAIRMQRRCLFVSLEMGERALTRRIIAEHSGVDGSKLRHPKTLRDGDWPKLAAAMGALDTDNLQIVESRRVSVGDIRGYARVTRATTGLDLVVIDYLQLIRSTERTENRDREVAEMCSALKDLALELNIPVVLLSQLNRANERRENKRPMLSDLRDSGSIEQDADVVVFVHRPSVYDDSKPTDVAELIVAKHRNGDTGVIDVGWEGRTTRFADRRLV